MSEQYSGFDITQQKQYAKKEDEGILVHIEGADGKPLFYDKDGNMRPVTMTVAGSLSSHYRRVEDQLRRKKLKLRNLSTQKLYKENIDKAAACVLQWEGIHDNGTPVELTEHNASMLFEACPWVFEQVWEAMNDHESFFSRG